MGVVIHKASATNQFQIAKKRPRMCDTREREKERERDRQTDRQIERESPQTRQQGL